MRATLSQLMTEANYRHMLAGAAVLAEGLRQLIMRYRMPWCVTQLGARIEFQFCPVPPRNGTEAGACLDGALEHLIHLALLNREVMITPFHNMMLICPHTSDADIQRLLTAFEAVAGALCGA